MISLKKVHVGWGLTVVSLRFIKGDMFGSFDTAGLKIVVNGVMESVFEAKEDTLPSVNVKFGLAIAGREGVQPTTKHPKQT